MTPGVFITKWRVVELKERSAAQSHFNDLCRLLGEPTPTDADPAGEWYCFERGARKDSGGGWADVWKWMRRNGFRESRDPILKPLETIECRDAILAPDGTESDWPDADVVLGNPPFHGGKVLIGGLGEDYVYRMFVAWKGRVPPEADLVCYWFAKAGEQVGAGKVQRWPGCHQLDTGRRESPGLAGRDRRTSDL